MIWAIYILKTLLTNVLGFISAWLVYLLAYPQRHGIRMFRGWYTRQGIFIKIALFPAYLPCFGLWCYLNDGVSADGFSRNKKSNGEYTLLSFWLDIDRFPSWYYDEILGNPIKYPWWNDLVVSWRWSAIRNVTWNMYSLPWFVCKKGEKENMVVRYSRCYNLMLRNMPVAADDLRELKFYRPNKTADNEGLYLDYGAATLGRNYVIYEIQGHKYFTWGRAGVTILWERLLHWEFQFGYTKNHNEIRMKLKFKPFTDIGRRQYNEYLQCKT